MVNSFTAEFFKRNREQLRKYFIGKAPIVLTANGLLQLSRDSTYKFKQDGNFWYLTGIDEPDIILVIDKDKEYLIVPDQSKTKKDFDGELDTKSLSEISGITTIIDQKTGWKQLNNRLSRVKHVATLPPANVYIDVLGFYTNPSRANLVSKIKEINHDIELLDLSKHFSLMRMIKQPEELQAIKKAIEITSKSLKSVKNKINKYEQEYQIEADISHFFKYKNAVTHGFDPIVASGKNACTIHYMDNNSIVGPKDLIILDIGAEYQHYSADISRTFAHDVPSKRQLKVHTAVCEVQDFAYSLLKPGTILAEYETKVEQFMGEKLRTLGLIKNVEHNEIRKYYPHSVSHFLGFDVHDLGDYQRPLEPGIVLTVEPGIYIPEEAIGVRIEDDVLITDSGIEILTKNLPRDL